MYDFVLRYMWLGNTFHLPLIVIFEIDTAEYFYVYAADALFIC